jgi:uncharacterized SAM-binding protein YcdF (DUF218 family)
LKTVTSKSNARTHRTPKALRAKSAEQSGSFADVRAGRTARRRALWGLFDRRERWSLSWLGWLIVVCAFLLAGALFLKGAYPFLATTHRVDADVLAVEGWVHEYAVQAAVNEFRSGSYRRVFTTGGPVVGNGGYINDLQTSASVGADLLRKAGVPKEFVQMVPSHIIDRDRTYSSAIALRDWLQQHHASVKSINVVTENTHARRTRLLFQKALGTNVQVGIIAAQNPDYDKERWWWYSDGVKDVGSEALAYLYAKFFFWPAPREDRTQRTEDRGPVGGRALRLPNHPFVKSVSSVVETSGC